MKEGREGKVSGKKEGTKGRWKEESGREEVTYK